MDVSLLLAFFRISSLECVECVMMKRDMAFSTGFSWLSTAWFSMPEVVFSVGFKGTCAARMSGLKSCSNMHSKREDTRNLGSALYLLYREA